VSTMSRIDVFLDSSALFAGVASSTGAARALLLLAEVDRITITVSEQVITETERALARKLPAALGYYRQALRSTGLRIVQDPSPEENRAHQGIIRHPPDVAIVVAAMRADAGFIATFNRRHFIDDPHVASEAGIPIGTPGDALAWVRRTLTRESG